MLFQVISAGLDSHSVGPGFTLGKSDLMFPSRGCKSYHTLAPKKLVSVRSVSSTEKGGDV